jgi:N-acetyl-anhydromuramyl-L-alanine amidase AmpD
MTIREYRHGSLRVTADYLPAAVDSYSHRAGERHVRLLVLHSAECAEVPTAAESLAKWSNGPQHPKASWHFAVDSNSITQSVELHNVAWHAGIVNGYSIGIEQAGRAIQTAAQWHDVYSAQMLGRVSRLLAVLGGYYDLPLDYVTDKLETARGVTTHAAITRYFRVKGGHTDPGPNYPIDMVLDDARRYQLEAVT